MRQVIYEMKRTKKSIEIIKKDMIKSISTDKFVIVLLKMFFNFFAW